MNAIRTFAALYLAALATACASPGATDATPAAGMSPGMSDGGAPMPMAASDTRMKAMQEMHQKMMKASTPAERQALMAEHMKAMQGGMAMMKEMHAMHGGGGMGMGMGMMASSGSAAPMAGMAGMDHGKAMPADMSKRPAMMADHMAMMQMMMDMMADRMPPAPPTK